MHILGIDYGSKRIGTAASDPSGTFAMPHKVLEVTGDADAIKQLAELCHDKEVDRIVVGLPINMDGSEGPMARKAIAFAKALEKKLSVPVETWDERLSSYAADQVMLEADLSRARRKQVRDKLAAQVILQGYLDSKNLTPDT